MAQTAEVPRELVDFKSFVIESYREQEERERLMRMRRASNANFTE